MRVILITCIFILTILFAPSTMMVVAQDSEASPQAIFETETVEYQLPYPGILADHPFFFLKDLRNTYRIWTAPSHIPKSIEYLDQADSTIAMAQPLREKGKLKLSVESVAKANELFKQAVFHYKENEESTEESRAHLEQLRNANKKHREVADELLKEVPQGEISTLEDIRAQMIQVGTELEGLQ